MGERVKREFEIDKRLNELLEQRAKRAGQSSDEMLEAVLQKMLEPRGSQYITYRRLRRRFH